MPVSGKEIFDDYEGLKQAYEDIEEIAEEYELDTLNEAASMMEELVSENPSTSVYQIIPSAVRHLIQARDMVQTADKSNLSNVVDLLESEKKSHPAQTKQRHYDSFRDQQNL